MRMSKRIREKMSEFVTIHKQEQVNIFRFWDVCGFVFFDVIGVFFRGLCLVSIVIPKTIALQLRGVC
jgi:hypothetical protein